MPASGPLPPAAPEPPPPRPPGSTAEALPPVPPSPDEPLAEAKILVVNDDPTQLRLLTELLRQAGHFPLPCPGAEIALRGLDAKSPPDLVVTDLYMPGIDGWKFCRLLRSPEYQPFNQVPILIVSATYAGDEPAHITSDLGVEGFLPSPVDGPRFLAKVAEILRGDCLVQQPRILIVDDNLALAEVLVECFRRHGYECRVETTVRDARVAFATRDYEVVLLDYTLPDGNGDQLLDEFRRSHPECVCLMITAHPDSGLALDWMRRGAAAYLHKPFQPEYLVELCRRARRERALLRVQELLETRTRQLRDSEAHFRLIAEHTSDGVIMFADHQRIAFVSPSYLRQLGLETAHELGSSRDDLYALVHPEDRDDLFARINQAVSAGQRELEFSYRIRHRRGHYLWREDHANFHYDQTGQHLMTFVVSRDISERRQVEEILRRRDALLQAATEIGQILLVDNDAKRAMNRAIQVLGAASGQDRAYLFETHPDPQDGSPLITMRYEWVREGVSAELGNPQMHGLRFAEVAPFSYAKLSRGEVVSHLVREMPPSERAILEPQGIVSILLVPILLEQRWHGLIGFDNCREDYFWSAGETAVLTNVASSLGGAIARQRAEADRAKLQTQLAQAQKMESVGRLAGGVAHDFNNMLQAILGNVELALEEVPDVSPLRESLEEIRKCARHSADLTSQLLAFARKQTVKPKVLDLNRTIDGTLKMLRRTLGENIQLDWQPGPDLWPVQIDPSQIDQILTNLCLNGRDAIQGHGQVRIETSNVTTLPPDQPHPGGYAPGDYVLLSVRDDGCGMDEMTLTHLFEPFFTTKERGRGTGLGLATVYGIVQQNRGFISASSELGKGSTFRLYLPRYAGEAVAECVLPTGSTRGGHETILLVEDEVAVLKPTTRTLESLGYRVRPTNRPEEALALAANPAIALDLLITDLVMPALSGVELHRQIRQLRPELPCLYISGYAAETVALPAGWTEPAIFLAKPFSVAELTAKVRACLDDRPRPPVA